jgi:hypothetical protein
LTAGLPSAAELISYVRHAYPTEYGKALKKQPRGLKYETLMKEMKAVDRYDLFQNWAAVGRVNVAHAALAYLMRKRRVDYVLTTNFDDLLVRACALYALHPATHDLGSLARVGEGRREHFKSSYLRPPSILFLHGRHNGFWQVHHDDTQDQANCLAQVLGASQFRTKVWVIAGYSGDSDPLLDALREGVKSVDSVVWVNPKRPEDDYVAKLLSGSSASLLWVSEYADDFFGRWAEEQARNWRQAPRRELDALLRQMDEKFIDDSARRTRKAQVAIERGERALLGRGGAAAAQSHFKTALQWVDPAQSLPACQAALEEGNGSEWRSEFASLRARNRGWAKFQRALLGEVRCKIALGATRRELEKLSDQLERDHNRLSSVELQLALVYVEAARATVGAVMPGVGADALKDLQALLREQKHGGAAAAAVKNARAALRSRSPERAREAMLKAADAAAEALLH